MIPRAMTIAGSDSGAGAGIQADLKTFAAFEVYGTSAITAITAQNTVGVTEVFELPAHIVTAQIDAVLSDIGADAVKTGMLANEDIITAVAERLAFYHIDKLVVDPVMVSKSGHALLRAEAVDALKRRILPLCYLVTPNIPEAEVLIGMSISTEGDLKTAARQILEFGPQAVLLKGGHLEGDASDILYDGEDFTQVRAYRIDTKNTHGTGCTLSAAITASLAKGRSLVDSVRQAKGFITEAIWRSYSIGEGHSPVNHFHAQWVENQ